MKSVLHSLYWLLLFVVIFTLILFIWVTNTQAGSRWAVEKAASLSGQPVEIETFSGTLANRFAAESITYQLDSVNIAVQQFSFQWQPTALFKRELKILSLAAEEIRIELAEKQPEADPAPVSIPEFSLPVDVFLDDLRIQSLVIVQQQPLTINDIQLSANMKKDTLTIKSFHVKQANTLADIAGELQFKQPFPLQFDGDIHETALKAQTSFSLTGFIEDYQLSGALKSSNEQYPAFTGEYNTTGSLQDITINKLLLNLLEGSVELKGKVDWREGLNASVKLNADKINPGVYNEQLKGKLALSGSFDLTNNQFKTQLQSKGTLREYPLALELDAAGTTELIRIKKAKLKSGENLVSLDGELSATQARQLKWNIDAPLLSGLYEGLEGKLQGKGSLSGKWKTPEVSADLEGSKLGFNDIRIDSLNTRVRTIDASTMAYEISMNASDIQQAQQLIKKLTLNASGTVENHQAELELDHSEAKLMTALQGSYKLDNQSWQGQILNTSLNSIHWPELSQSQPATIEYQKNQIKLTPFCLQGPEESFCLEAEQTKEAVNVLLKLDSIPMKRFSRWIDEAEKLPEKINGQISVAMQQQQWEVISGIQLDAKNQFNSQFRFNPSTEQLSGNIKTDFDKLQWLMLFTDQITQPAGKLNADLVVAGSLKVPEVSGTVRMSNGRVRIPEIGTEITAISLNISPTSDGMALISGNATSGEGNLNLKGNARFTPVENWSASMKITGKNFQAVNLGHMNAVVSPDLNLEMAKSRVNLDGSITIPKAKILLADLPESAITVSEDARIVNEVQAEEKKPATLPVNANITVILGDDVTLEGKGLEAKLGGKLTIKETAGKQVSARGTIKILEGSYTAYGQDLELKDSSFIFNGPVTQPGLNLQAVRVIDDITAGLKITGTLDDPQSEIFSTPAMSESDAIAYLLTGKPLKSSGSSEGALITSALTSLGVKGSAGIIEQVRNKTGLSTLEIDTGNDSTQTALLVGKYLTPQLYVQYVKRLFLDSDALQLRYEINKNLQLEAESGTSQGIDLIYQFERD